MFSVAAEHDLFVFHAFVFRTCFDVRRLWFAWFFNSSSVNFWILRSTQVFWLTKVHDILWYSLGVCGQFLYTVHIRQRCLFHCKTGEALQKHEGNVSCTHRTVLKLTCQNIHFLFNVNAQPDALLDTLTLQQLPILQRFLQLTSKTSKKSWCCWAKRIWFYLLWNICLHKIGIILKTFYSIFSIHLFFFFN